MGKKVEQAKVQAQAEVKAEAHEAKAKGIEVNAMPMLKMLGLDWAFGGVEENDLDMLKAKVTMDESGTEWVSFITQYRRMDGTPVHGLAWGISLPMVGGFMTLRLLEGGRVLVTIKAWPTGKAILTGEDEIVKALANRPDLPKWTIQDTASLL